MALSSTNEAIIRDLITEAQTELDARDRKERLIARWNLNDTFNQISDADVTAVFPGLDKSKVSNSVNALTATLTALGDNVSGQATNLIRMKP